MGLAHVLPWFVWWMIAQIKEATEATSKIAEQLPGVAAILIVVAIFIWYLVRRDRESSQREQRANVVTSENKAAAMKALAELSADHKEGLKVLSEAQRQAAKDAAEVIKENAQVYGRTVGVLERIERWLTKSDITP